MWLLGCLYAGSIVTTIGNVACHQVQVKHYASWFVYSMMTVMHSLQQREIGWMLLYNDGIHAKTTTANRKFCLN